MGFTFGEFENRPITSVVAISLDTTVTAGRSLAAIVTTGGNISVVLAGGQTRVYPLTPGLNILPLAVTRVNATGTTATGTFENWL